jgi:hypothetical protein
MQLAPRSSPSFVYHHCPPAWRERERGR